MLGPLGNLYITCGREASRAHRVEAHRWELRWFRFNRSVVLSTQGRKPESPCPLSSKSTGRLSWQSLCVQSRKRGKWRGKIWATALLLTFLGFNTLEAEMTRVCGT